MEKNEEKAANSGEQQPNEADQHEIGTPDFQSTTGHKPHARQSNNQPCDGQEDAKKKLFWTRFSAVSQAVFSVFLVGVGVGQICVYVRQADIMRTQSGIAQNQLNEMQSEQRAWVSITNVSGVASMNIDEVNGQLQAVMTFTLQNTGKNPAIAVFVNTEASMGWVLPIGSSMHAWEKAVCDLPKGSYGLTLFPNALETTYKVKANTHQGELAQWRSTMSKNGAEALAVVPKVAACIIYQDAVTGLIHHTPMAFEIWRRVPGKEDGCCAAIELKSLPLQQNDIGARRWTMDNLPPD